MHRWDVGSKYINYRSWRNFQSASELHAAWISKGCSDGNAGRHHIQQWQRLSSAAAPESNSRTSGQSRSIDHAYVPATVVGRKFGQELPIQRIEGHSASIR